MAFEGCDAVEML